VPGRRGCRERSTWAKRWRALALTVALAGASSCAGLTEATPPAERASPMTKDAYQAQLTAATGIFVAAFDGVRKARTPADLATALTSAGRASEQAALKLSEGLAPPDVQDSSGGLVRDMRLLARNDVPLLVQQASAVALCAGPAAIARASNLSTVQHLRSEAQLIRSHGYQLAELLAPATPDPNRKLANGQLVLDPGNRSDAPWFEADNGPDQDAVVTLVLNQKPVLAMFVPSGAKARVDGVPNGIYDVYFTKGEDWDPDLGTFTRKCSYQRFADRASYDGNSDYTYYLSPSPTGTAKLTNVLPADYPRP
jgi:hypothetical protein